MLTPEYLAGCSDYILGLYDQLETQIVTDIARRLVENGYPTDTAIWQYQQVQEIGALQDEVNRQISEMTGKTAKEIEKLFKEAGAMNIETNAAPLVAEGIEVDRSMSIAMRQVLEAEIRRTQGDLMNLTRTTAGTAASLYQQMSNQAYMQSISGAFSPQQALRTAILGAAQEGAYVQFAKRRDHLDVAIRRNLLTSVNQTAAKLTEIQAEAMGVEYYEVSAHFGARPSHSVWQGKIYKIDGSSFEYPNFADSTGYGTAGGLCGVNCRHNFYPFWPGISKPNWPQERLDEFENHRVKYKGVEYSDYEASQEQRAQERDIRELRRQLASLDAAMQAATDDELQEDLSEDFKKKAKLLKARERELKKFCRETGRTYESNRVQVVAYKDKNGRVVRFGRSTSQKAVHASKKD